MNSHADDHVSAPRPPEIPQAFRFPVLATVAPVIGSLVLWAITSSPFALVFAALGPVTALASLADARIGGRRLARRERLRFERDAARVRAEIAGRHAAERAKLAEETPGAAELVRRVELDPSRWRAEPGSPVLVRLGTGSIPSALEFTRPEVGTAGSSEVETALSALAADAAALGDAPIRADALLGIGICGPPAFATSLARAVAVQLAHSLSPQSHRWWAPTGTEEEWMAALPHARGSTPAPPGQWIAFGDEQPGPGIAVAAGESELPASCRIVVVLGAGTCAVARHPDRGERREFRPGLLAAEEALAWARSTAADATRAGITAGGVGLPAAVRLESLLRQPDPADRSLACELGLEGRGALTVDLVAHGPHAVVGGTTGSGKSELLIAWVLAMAAAHPPERVNFLLVDFKGGSAFSALARLPHAVGTITDLDDAQAARALASLRAELRYREGVLVARGARGIEEIDDLPRLVIVVDEFAAMIAGHPDLHALFSDLAARGRSLGVHLVLCTQRPAGAVRDGVLANADLRISLRVNNRADSIAVVGTDAATTIPAQARGRGVIVLAGETAASVQFAIASPHDVAAVAARHTDSRPIRRPWCEPLPAIVHVPRERGERGIPFGLLDLPHEQRRDVAHWNPASDGNLLVLGAPGSGLSTTLAAIGAGENVPRDPAGAWDVVDELLTRLGAGEYAERIVTLDDADSLFARLSTEYRPAFIERLCRLLRDGPAAGIRFAITAQRITADLQPLAALAPARLLLRHGSRHEFVLAGGDGSFYLADLPPGGGLWRGSRVQVALVPVAGPSPVPLRVRALDPSKPLAVATFRPAAVAARLREAGFVVAELAGSTADPRELVIGGVATRRAAVGDVEEWQSRWGSLAALRSVAHVLLDGCSTADLRALTRSREPPPPLDGHADLCWLLEEGGATARARLPGAAA